MYRILIAEDDETIKEELASLLAARGYCPVYAPPCELALLDVNLPGDSGYALCKKIKQSSDVPVIFLTARDGAADEVFGFEVGGDDYIKKPYNPDILLARIARLLKEDDILCAKGIMLDRKGFTVSYNGNCEQLTRTEAGILCYLMKNKVCSKDDIITALWENNSFIDENALYVNINRLRAKLKNIGCEDGIKTLRGAGYSL